MSSKYMRRLLTAGVTGLVTALILISVVLAQGPNQPEYTNFQIQNLSDAVANVVVQVYNVNGSIVATKAITIPAGSSTSFSQNPAVPDPLGLPSGFIGSVVISSDQPVGAIGNQYVALNSLDPRIAASYTGISQPSTELFFPLHYRRYNTWDTRIFLQNTTDVTATVTITYTYDNFSGSKVNHTETGLSIPPRGLLVRKLYNDLPVLGNQWEGSARVSSNVPLAGVADGFYSGAPYNFEMSYNALSPDDAGTKLYAPVIYRRYKVPQFGWNTNIYVVNMGTAPAQVQVTYIGGGLTTPVTETQIITNSGRFQQDSSAVLPEDFEGSAVIESLNGQPIAAVVLEATSRGPLDRATAYNAVSASKATTRASLPMLMRTYYCSLIWNTAVPVLNTQYDVGPAEVYITYSGGGLSAPIQRRFTITDSMVIRQFNETGLPGGLPCVTGWRGSGVITSTRPIVAIVKQNALAVTGDLSQAYNAIGY